MNEHRGKRSERLRAWKRTEGPEDVLMSHRVKRACTRVHVCSSICAAMVKVEHCDLHEQGLTLDSICFKFNAHSVDVWHRTAKSISR